MSYFYITNIWNITNPFSFPQIISCKRDLKCKSQKFDIQDLYKNTYHDLRLKSS